jgi:hypothetical protein
MRFLTIAGLIALCSQFVLCEDSRPDFLGSWRLNREQSQIRTRFDIPYGFLRVTRSATATEVAASVQEGQPSTIVFYPATPAPAKSEANGLTFSVTTEWDGAAMLATIVVGGQSDYSMSERWVKSPDGGHLTITRTLEEHGARVESVLQFDKIGGMIEDFAQPAPPLALAASPHTETLRQPEPPSPEFVLPAGTRILLRLTNAVNTKRSVPGDLIYLETAFPVFRSGSIVIPQGSFVQGEITEFGRPGRVKGKSALNFRFDTLTLPNGVTRDFRSRAGSVDTQSSLDRKEGKITGEGTKGQDTATVAETAAGGTALGATAGLHGGNLGLEPLH